MISTVVLPCSCSGKRVVAGLAAVADDRVEDEALDAHEHDGGQDEDDDVEVEDVLAGLGHRIGRKQAAGQQADEQQGGSDAEGAPQPRSGHRSLHQMVSRLLVQPTRRSAA